MRKSSKSIAISLIIILLILLVVLSLGFVEISASVMYSLFLSILFIVALVVIPHAFERKERKKKR